MKICACCHIEKELDMFGNLKKSIDGKHYYCKECIKKHNQSENAKKARKKHNIKRLQTEEYKEYQKEYRKSEKYKEYKKEYGKSEKYKKYQKKYQKEYRKSEKHKEIVKKYEQKHKQQISEYRKKYKKSEKYIEYQNNRKKTDILFKLKMNISCLIRNSIKKNGYKKSIKTENILGCSIEEFKQYIENLFESWMNWNNHGVLKSGKRQHTWQIDHIIPLSSAKTEEDVLKLNHYKNLQPLDAYTNVVLKNKNSNYETK